MCVCVHKYKTSKKHSECVDLQVFTYMVCDSELTQVIRLLLNRPEKYFKTTCSKYSSNKDVQVRVT